MSDQIFFHIFYFPSISFSAIRLKILKFQKIDYNSKVYTKYYEFEGYIKKYFKA